jgi:6-pyruvoyltetrahydropterin/6-carboxytetrahydropterin synthase
MANQFRVSLLKEQLTFSAAHFITFGDNVCESLHGHNYGLRCDVIGPLNEHGYVVDFIALRDELSRIVRELDHAVLLPLHHAAIRVEPGVTEVLVSFESRRWVFPRGDCRLLPIANTTAELIAQHIAEQLLAWIQRQPVLSHNLREIEVCVDENHGQWGCCRAPVLQNETLN